MCLWSIFHISFLCGRQLVIAVWMSHCAVIRYSFTWPSVCAILLLKSSRVLTRRAIMHINLKCIVIQRHASIFVHEGSCPGSQQFSRICACSQKSLRFHCWREFQHSNKALGATENRRKWLSVFRATWKREFSYFRLKPAMFCFLSFRDQRTRNNARRTFFRKLLLKKKTPVEAIGSSCHASVSQAGALFTRDRWENSKSRWTARSKEIFLWRGKHWQLLHNNLTWAIINDIFTNNRRRSENKVIQMLGDIKKKHCLKREVQKKW